MERTQVQTEAAPQAIGPYEQAVRVGETVYCSGQIALRPDGTFVQGGVAEQTRQVLENLGAVLAAAGGSLADVVKTTVYLTDLGAYAEMNGVYAGVFGERPPARAAVEVARLPKDARVEIDCIAVVPAQ